MSKRKHPRPLTLKELRKLIKNCEGAPDDTRVSVTVVNEIDQCMEVFDVILMATFNVEDGTQNTCGPFYFPPNEWGTGEEWYFRIEFTIDSKQFAAVVSPA